MQINSVNSVAQEIMAQRFIKEELKITCAAPFKNKRTTTTVKLD